MQIILIIRSTTLRAMLYIHMQGNLQVQIYNQFNEYYIGSNKK